MIHGVRDGLDIALEGRDLIHGNLAMIYVAYTAKSNASFLDLTDLYSLSQCSA